MQTSSQGGLRKAEGCRTGAMVECDVAPALIEALEAQGITSLLPIQERTWKALQGGRRRFYDLRICSPTGSGKTLAYALPIVQEVLRSSEHKRRLECITILPTRDLALQVHAVYTKLLENASRGSASVGLCCGLASLDEESAQFERTGEEGFRQGRPLSVAGRGAMSILVATPGRLKSHLERKSVTLSHLKFLVLDEMDRLLQQSYNDCIPFLLEEHERCRRLDKSAEDLGPAPGIPIPLSEAPSFLAPQYKCIEPRLVKVSVSATISKDSSKTMKIREECVRMVSGFDLGHPTGSANLGDEGEGGKPYELPAHLEEYRVVCKKEKKPFALLALLQKVKKEAAICFTNSTEASQLVDHLIRKKTKEGDLPGWRTDAYNSRKTPTERLEALERFKRKEIDLLIASDALSRGIDLPAVRLVINYDMPTSTKNYVHRVGRTARVGEDGVAITILQWEDVVHFKRLRDKLGKKKIPDFPLRESTK